MTHMLWLAIHFPHLALDTVANAGEEKAAPFAITEHDGRRERVHARNRAAAGAGVALNMPVSAALALCGHLTLRPRDADGEAQALDGLAAWALQFSDAIHVQPPDGLLIEIGGSLQLFGGLDTLRRRIADELLAIGYHGRFGIAPTPLAARWLARARIDTPVLTDAELTTALATLPLAVLELPDDALARLHGLGLSALGDCLHLPRAGLAKRFGTDVLDALDRALGHRPDPHRRFEAPPRFERLLWLPSEVEHTDALLFAARRLLLELGGFLRGRGAGTRSFTLRLLRNRAPADTLTLNLVAPSRDAAHLLALLRERLARHRLTAPVHGIAIAADAFTPLAHQPQELFAKAGAHDDNDWQPLVETLRARLGNDAVHGLHLQADHRPEFAWTPGAPGEHGNPDASAGPRPLWLFRTPQAAPDGLTIVSGPERIESGWWTEKAAAEDYFVVTTANGERYWACVRDGQVRLVGIF